MKMNMNHVVEGFKYLTMRLILNELSSLGCLAEEKSDWRRWRLISLAS